VVDGPAAGQAALGFGSLLRRLRDEAGLTQDELAEAAQVSQRAISDLERGINATARKDTAVLLAGALGLDESARELFVAAARGRAPADDVLAAAAGVTGAGASAAATRTLPRDIATFTGRQDELKQLMARWTAAEDSGGVVSVHAIGGMAGIGKTTFAVHAAHQLAAGFPDGQFFLPLHAHTPGSGPWTRPMRWPACRVVGNQPLDDQHPAVLGHGPAAGTQDPHRVGVIPVVQHVGQDVGVRPV
jgi:transcriptional regulator with XRE-family HTH domain